MKLIVTTRELRYGGKPFYEGETFEAEPQHAVALKILKKAADAPPEPVGQVATTHAPAGAAGASVQPSTRRSRSYRTRVLKAED